MEGFSGVPAGLTRSLQCTVSLLWFLYFVEGLDVIFPLHGRIAFEAESHAEIIYIRRLQILSDLCINRKSIKKLLVVLNSDLVFFQMIVSFRLIFYLGEFSQIDYFNGFLIN